MRSGEYKQVPTGQDGPSRSYGTQRVAVERSLLLTPLGLKNRIQMRIREGKGDTR